MRRRRWSWRCASAWSFQKSGWLISDSSFSTSSRGPPASKMPPKLRRSLRQVVVPPDQIVEFECH